MGERLQYQLRSGEGPKTGWVSISLKDKVPHGAADRGYDRGYFRRGSHHIFLIKWKNHGDRTNKFCTWALGFVS